MGMIGRFWGKVKFFGRRSGAWFRDIPLLLVPAGAIGLIGWQIFTCRHAKLIDAWGWAFVKMCVGILMLAGGALFIYMLIEQINSDRGIGRSE